MNKCLTCGKNCEKEYCFQHAKRKPLPKVGGFKSKTPVENDRKPGELSEMNQFFLSIWNKREHKSEVSGEKIYGEALTIYFHHILSKHKNKFAEYDEDNIILLTFAEHQKVEQDMYFYEEINKRREYLKTKYNL